MNQYTDNKEKPAEHKKLTKREINSKIYEFALDMILQSIIMISIILIIGAFDIIQRTFFPGMFNEHLYAVVKPVFIVIVFLIFVRTLVLKIQKIRMLS